MRGNCLHEWVAKRPGLAIWEYVWQIRRMIIRHLEVVPNSCLRFEENQTFFLLLTLKRDLKWRYRVDELHPELGKFVLGGGVVGVTANPWE